MEVGAELPIFLADLGELGGDGYYAGDSGAEDGEDGALASCNGLEGMGGEVLYLVGVELEAIPVFGEDCFQEGERGGGA